jgi:hypothetical protein
MKSAYVLHAASNIAKKTNRYPRLCVFAYEYFVFLGRVTSTSENKEIFLEDQFE